MESERAVYTDRPPPASCWPDSRVQYWIASSLHADATCRVANHFRHRLEMRQVANTLSSLHHLAPGSLTSPAAALAAAAAAAAARLPPSLAPSTPSSIMTMATAASSSTLFARAAAVVAPTRRGAPAAIASRRRPSAAFRTLPPAPIAAAGLSSNNGQQGFSRNSSRLSTRAVAADVTDASDGVSPAAAAAAEAGASLMSSELTWPHRTQTCGRGLHSFLLQLNLSCFVGHKTQLNPCRFPEGAQVELSREPV